MTEPIRAAGGLLQRAGPGGIRVAVVRRTRYRDRSGNAGDTVLPKGKAEPGEDYVGFIAEEVPELVASDGRQSMSAMDVVGVLTRVVQQQQETIDELSERIRVLEQRD